MADPSQEVQKQVEGAVEAAKDKLNKGTTWDQQRATELGQGFIDMKMVLRKAESAIANLKVEKPEDAERAREVFKREITQALTAFRDAIQGREQNAIFLVQTTRDGLETIGELAAKGPEVKERFASILKTPQIDEWLQAVERDDPQNALNAMIGVTRGAVDEIATGEPTEGARRDGVKMVAQRGTNVLARYLSGGTIA